MLTEISLSFAAVQVEVGHDDFLSDTLAIRLGHPEVAIWKIVGSALGGGVLVERSHKSVVSFALESIWDVSLVSVVSAEAVHPVWIVFRSFAAKLWLTIVLQPRVESGIGFDLNFLNTFVTVGLRIRVAIRLTLSFLDLSELRIFLSSFDGLDLLDLSEGKKTQKSSNSKYFIIINLVYKLTDLL